MFDKIYKLACECRQAGDYRTAAVLSSVLTDLAIYEDREALRVSLDKSLDEMRELQAQLKSVGLHRLAKQVDVVAQDLEARALAFSVDNPIESVLHSYKVIHKLASTPKEVTTISHIRDLIESESVDDSELPEHIKKITLGLSDREKQDILYVLEKDYNLTIPLEKIAKKKKPKKTKEEQCLQNAKTLEERLDCLNGTKQHNPVIDRPAPTSPSMWSGFAYEAVIPYHQNSQVNFWSIASDEEKVLKRIAKGK